MISDTIKSSCNVNPDSGKKKIILDLDSTIIYSEPSTKLDSKNFKKMAKFTFYDMDGYYTVFERPHLQKFLNYIFKHFDVSVWTAATKDYALFIVEKIILKKGGKKEGKEGNKSKGKGGGKENNRKLECFFYSYHCDISENCNKGHKGLSLLWENVPGYTKDNTIIIDDLPDVCENQENNCINIKPFVFTDENSENDTELLNIIKKLKSM